ECRTHLAASCCRSHDDVVPAHRACRPHRTPRAPAIPTPITIATATALIRVISASNVVARISAFERTQRSPDCCYDAPSRAATLICSFVIECGNAQQGGASRRKRQRNRVPGHHRPLRRSLALGPSHGCCGPGAAATTAR